MLLYCCGLAPRPLFSRFYACLFFLFPPVACPLGLFPLSAFVSPVPFCFPCLLCLCLLSPVPWCYACPMLFPPVPLFHACALCVSPVPLFAFPCALACFPLYIPWYIFLWLFFSATGGSTAGLVCPEQERGA